MFRRVVRALSLGGFVVGERNKTFNYFIRKLFANHCVIKTLPSKVAVQAAVAPRSFFDRKLLFLLGDVLQIFLPQLFGPGFTARCT